MPSIDPHISIRVLMISTITILIRADSIPLNATT